MKSKVQIIAQTSGFPTDSHNLKLCRKKLKISHVPQDSAQYCLQKCIWEKEGTINKKGVLNINSLILKKYYNHLLHDDADILNEFKLCLRRSLRYLKIKRCKDIVKVNLCYSIARGNIQERIIHTIYGQQLLGDSINPIIENTATYIKNIGKNVLPTKVYSVAYSVKDGIVDIANTVSSVPYSILNVILNPMQSEIKTDMANQALHELGSMTDISTIGKIAEKIRTNNLINDAGNFVTQLPAALVNIGSYKQQIVDAADNVSKYVIPSLVQGIALFGHRVLDNVTGLIYNNFGTATNSVLEDVTPQLTDVNNLEQNIANNAENVVPSILEGITNSIQTVANNFIEGAKNSILNIVQRTISGNNSAATTTRSITYRAIPIDKYKRYPNMAKANGTVRNYLSDTAENIATAMLPAITNGAQKVASSFYASAEKAANSIMPHLVNGVSAMANSFVQKAENTAAALVPDMINGFNTVGNQLVNTAGNVAVAMVPHIANGVQTVANNFVHSAGNAASSVVPHLINGVNAVAHSLLEKAKNTADIMTNKVLNSVDSVGNVLTESAGNVASAIVPHITNSFETATKNIFDNIGVAASTVVQDIINKFTKSVENVGNKATNIIPNVVNAVSEAAGNVADAIVPQITDTVKKAAGNLIDIVPASANLELDFGITETTTTEATTAGISFVEILEHAAADFLSNGIQSVANNLFNDSDKVNPSHETPNRKKKAAEIPYRSDNLTTENDNNTNYNTGNVINSIVDNLQGAAAKFIASGFQSIANNKKAGEVPYRSDILEMVRDNNTKIKNDNTGIVINSTVENLEDIHNLTSAHNKVKSAAKVPVTASKQN